ncbi:MAG TPA: DUF3943 domain-containing protein [Spirochaetota bacterium]|nr:DUF3943 domain-containing protein [Spirochaetota bacterium]
MKKNIINNKKAILKLVIVIIAITHIYSCQDGHDYIFSESDIRKESNETKTFDNKSENMSDDIETDDEFNNSISSTLATNFTNTMYGVGSILGSGTVWYYLEKSNKRDQFFNSGDDIRTRFTSFDAWRFDDNLFETNAVSHPMAGAGYFLSARLNNYNQYESFLFSLGGSLVWEYFCEFQEVVSINDMIFTPVGGYAIGESFFQLVNFYADNSSNSSLGDTIQYYTKSQDGRYKNGLRNSQGNNPFWYNAYLYGGYSQTDSEHYTTHFGLYTQFYGTRGVKENGYYNKFLYNSPYTKIEIDFGAGNTWLKDCYLFFESGHLSYVNQNLHNEKAGYAFIATLTTAFEYRNYYYQGFRDRIGAVSPVKLNTDFLFDYKDFSINLELGLSPNFAQVSPFGLGLFYQDGYHSDYLREHGAHTTANRGYYFGYGFSSKNSLTISYKKYQSGLSYNFDYYKSINTDGLTNREEPTNKNFKMKDERSVFSSWLKYDITDAWSLVAKYYRNEIEGTVEDYSRSDFERSIKLLTLYNFR